MINAVRVVISGRVQGVGYRAWAIAAAGGLGLRGWVRNRNDGSVEAVFCGEEETVMTMIESCKDGPMMARVDRIESFVWKDEVEDNLFTAKPTV
jgi:acylphosphatase